MKKKIASVQPLELMPSDSTGQVVVHDVCLGEEAVRTLTLRGGDRGSPPTLACFGIRHARARKKRELPPFSGVV